MSNIEGFSQTQKGNKHDSAEVTMKMRETREALNEAAHKAKEAAGMAWEQSTEKMKERSQEFRQNVVEYVRKEPWKAIGGAVVAGMVLSWLLRR